MSRKRSIESKNFNLTLSDFNSPRDNYEPIKIISKKKKSDTICRYEVEFKMRYTKENIERLIRKKYSVSDELALLRQKDIKPSEYEEYFNYVEEIKTKLKKGEF